MEIINKDYIQELPFKKNDNGNYIVIPKSRNYSGVDSVNKKRFPNGYIYFLNLKGTQFYKIGVSQNVKRRLQDINASTPFEVTVLSIHYFKNVYDIEKIYKEKLYNYIQKGEWLMIKDISLVEHIMIDLHNLDVTRNNK
jgi:hypothetical protein